MTILVALITMIYSNSSNIWQQTWWFDTWYARALRRWFLEKCHEPYVTLYVSHHKHIFYITNVSFISHTYISKICFILFIYDWFPGRNPNISWCTSFATIKRGLRPQNGNQQGLNIRRTYPGRTLKNIFLTEFWKIHAAFRVLRPQNGFYVRKTCLGAHKV